MKTVALHLCLLAALGCVTSTTFGDTLLVPGSEDHWPMAGGATGSWSTAGKAVPTQWSVAMGPNIRWRTPLPEGGQSGLAVWGDRLFLTNNTPLPANTAVADAAGTISIDRATSTVSLD